MILADPQAAPEGGLAEQGVSCAVCHVRDGEILAVDAPFWARLFHPIREEPRLAEADFCGGCHEFPFQRHTPRFPFAYGETLSQATLTEWRGSSAAARGQRCQGCHMPSGSHAFPGAHDAALVRGALAAEVVAGAPDRAVVTVVARGAAHAVPTGDPFRRLVVELCEDEGCSSLVGQAVLRRALEPDETSWVIASDTTVPPAVDGEEARRRLEVQTTAPALAWRLWLYYGDARFHEHLPEEEVRLLVAEGRVLAPLP